MRNSFRRLDLGTFLPIDASWWVYLGRSATTVEFSTPAGQPVHCVADGRVASVDVVAVGEVVIRANGRRYHYRRLRSSTLQLDEGAVVSAGQMLGVVAEPADGSQPKFIFGIQDEGGTWIDPFDELVGAIDPAELQSSAATPTVDDPLVRAVGRSGQPRMGTQDADSLVASPTPAPSNSTPMSEVQTETAPIEIPPVPVEETEEPVRVEASTRVNETVQPVEPVSDEGDQPASEPEHEDAVDRLVARPRKGGSS